MTTHGNAAIFYNVENYTTAGPKLMGLQSANESFFKAFARYAQVDTAYCFHESPQIFKHFTESLKKFAPQRSVPTAHIPRSHYLKIQQVGCMYIPSPSFGEYAWHRRIGNQRAFSLCGLTHTISSERAMGFLGNLVTAPTQPWDALICTSTAVKQSAEHLMQRYAEYMGQRFGAAPATYCPIQMPVIPLGVLTEDFHTGDKKAQLRAEWRKKLNIAEDTIVVLFVGRLSFHAKAHPHAMYQALEIAAQRTGKKIHLIQAGWAANEHIDAAFNEGAKQICPSVTMQLLDGRDPHIKTTIWYAADIFCSLSDNIQETFGLTPIEAMAAGLPVVVTDWDGYKDTVQAGVQGFMVPTLCPPAPAGGEYAFRFAMELDNYDIYIGQSCLSVSVDIAETARAFEQLIANPALRQQMGEAGRKRAEEIYDWRHIIASYQALWAELGAIRTHAGTIESAPKTGAAPANPLYDDPFALFANYPTQMVNPADVLMPVVADLFDAAKQARARKMSNFGMFPNDTMLKEFTDILHQNAGKTCGEVMPLVTPQHRHIFLRTLPFFSKMGLLAIGTHNAGLLPVNAADQAA